MIVALGLCHFASVYVAQRVHVWSRWKRTAFGFRPYPAPSLTNRHIDLYISQTPLLQFKLCRNPIPVCIWLFFFLHAYHQNDIQDFYLFFNVFLSRALVLFVLHLYSYSITKFMEWLSSILIHSVFICRRLTFYAFWRPEMTFAPDSFGERKCWISRLLIVLGKEDEEYQGRVTNMLAGC